MSEFPRIRRELRTLTASERDLYFTTIKVMRNTSGINGRKLFGNQFRTYEHILWKHAVSALHLCADQGHLPHNVITYHRALLLEFELSVLSIAKTINPSTTLRGLPYWNWFIDLEHPSESILESSVWKWWGSPFGNPKDKYCIDDIEFNTKVPTISMVEQNEPDILKHMKQLLHTPTFVANPFGYLRDPFSTSTCVGIARNPGWAANTPINEFTLKDQADDCLSQQDYFNFSFCTSGLGINDPR